jgi:integrase
MRADEKEPRPLQTTRVQEQAFRLTRLREDCSMRQPQPWFRTSKNAWYVEFDGSQRSLGLHPEDAPPPKKGKTGWNPPDEIRRAYKKLLAEESPRLPEPSRIKVRDLLRRFLKNARQQNDLRTYRWYLAYLKDFNRRYRQIRVMDLKPYHVTNWLNSHSTWKSSRRHAIIAVKRAFNWADREGVFSPSPIRGVKKPPVNRRPAVLTKSERKQILEFFKDQEFRSFVEAMQESGARASEIARLTAAEVNLQLGVCVLHKHKTASKTGKPRVIYMTTRFIAIVEPLMLKYPEGPLFRGPRYGRPFGVQGVCSRFRRLREKLPHLKNAISRAYRHSFAVDGLTSGVGIAQMAELLGHVDTSMVSRHYGILADQISHMREAANKSVS